MANLKSAKKQAKRSEAKRQRNLARKSAFKTAIKKFMAAVSANDATTGATLLKEIEAKLARAKSKRVIHANAASRKISRLALRLNEIQK